MNQCYRSGSHACLGGGLPREANNRQAEVGLDEAERMAEHEEWWQRPLAIADLGIYGVDEVLRLDPVEVAETKARLGFNAEHITCSDVYGGEKGIFYFRSALAEKVPRDFFGEYLPQARKRGIRVLVYYNVHWLQAGFAMRHPEWLQINAQGKAIDNLYGSGCAPCVNSPWREWSLQGIRDLAAYEIDGIFLDGPIFAPGACHCPSCRRLFWERHGTDLPGKEDWKDPSWRDFIEFRYDSIALYLKDAGRALKEARSGSVIYMNCTGLWPAWPAARDNRRLMPYQDILGAEGGFLYYDLRQSPPWKPGMTAKLLETQADGKPTVVFIAGANKGWDEYILSPTETRLLYADTIANGANPWYGISYRTAGRPGALAASEMNRFILANSDYLAGTKSLSRVALLWSARTADYYKASVPVTDFTPQGEKLERRQAAGNFSSSFAGCYEAFLRSHVPFDVLDEGALTHDVLGRYDLLVLPNCACLSDSHTSNIDDWVDRGGNLIASFEASRYDENGDMRSEFGLSETFGVRMGDGVFGPMKLDYMSIVHRDSAIAGGLSASLLPCPVYGIQVVPTTARSVAMYHGKMPARYVEVPPISNNPAILINEYGKGRCLYMAGNFFEHYHDYHNPDYRRIVANAADLMARRLVSLKGCPTSVEVALRFQPAKGRLMVHLVNFTGEMTRPMESVVDLSDLEVTLHGLAGIKLARALRLGRGLEISRLHDGVSFIVPRLEEHETIVLEALKP